MAESNHGAAARVRWTGLLVLMGLTMTVMWAVDVDGTAAQTGSREQTGTREIAKNVIERPWTGDLDGMIARRLIRVATTYNKTHYFIDKGVQRGCVYEAFTLLENQINATLKPKQGRVSVVFIPMSRDELLKAVVEGRADMAAAALTITPERQKIVDFTPPTMINISEVVVTGPQSPAIARVEDLAGQGVFVRKSSSFYESLTALNQRLKAAGKPEAVLKPAPEALETEDLLEMVNAGLVKITIADSHIAAFWKQILPNLVVHDDVAIRTGGSLGVAMRKNSPRLMAAAEAWGKKYGPRTMFGNMMVRRYLQSTAFAKSATSEAEMRRFQATIEIFRKYGDQYKMDWLLMAAQGFQESGLDHTRKSQVGAIGVMQVMPATGKELQVGDIAQIDPNIHAGVKYIRFMIDTYFANEPMDDLNKGLFAFASYNAGPGRIRQLRREAAQRGLNPNLWFNNVERVAAERIGRETVQYVSNIYKYYVAYRLALDELAERRKSKQGVPPS
jgi:membrane-bound lytic murein transglycosylase MltF